MWNFPWSMVIFHNFLQLPEGIMYSLESLSEHGDHGGLTIPWVRKTCHVWNDGCGNSPTHGWMIQCEFLESIRAIIVGFMSQNPGTLGTLKWLVMDDYSPNMIIIGHRVWSIPTITYIYIDVNTCISRSYFMPMSIQIWGTALGFRGRPPRHGSRPNTRSYIWLCRWLIMVEQRQKYRCKSSLYVLYVSAYII